MAWTDGDRTVLVQWATATATDWVAYTINSMSEVRAMPKKPEPSDSPVIDNQPGWVAAVNIQGVGIEGWDHVGFDVDGQGRLVVGGWNDDVADWPLGPWGILWTFDSLAIDYTITLTAEQAARWPHLARVGPLDGLWHPINTRQTSLLHVDLSVAQAMAAADSGFQWMLAAPRQPWSAWPRFNRNNIIHGVWVDSGLWQQYHAARTPHGFEDWLI